MKLAAIDIGSNTVRMLIGSVEAGMLRPIRYEREVTRLASGIASGGMLGDAAMQRTFDAIARFMRIAREEAVVSMLAAGTSALREASNAEALLGRIRDGLGLDVEVLDDKQEALTMARGVVSSFDGVASALIIDIGGGSTEAIAYAGGEVMASISVPVGVVKLADRHLKSDPPGEGELGWMEAEAASVALLIYDRLAGLIEDGAAFISTAGTPTTLAAIDMGLQVYDPDSVHGHLMSLERIESLYGELTGLDNAGRLAVKGMEHGREDLIMPGIILTIKLMEAFSFDRMMVSDRGLLDGLLQKLATDAGLI